MKGCKKRCLHETIIKIVQREMKQRNRKLAAAAALAAFLYAAPMAVAAQCAPAQLMLPALERTGEMVVWQGVLGTHLALLMQHPTSTSAGWTFVAVSPERLVCVLAHGTDAELRGDVRARTSASVPDPEGQNDRHR